MADEAIRREWTPPAQASRQEQRMPSVQATQGKQAPRREPPVQASRQEHASDQTSRQERTPPARPPMRLTEEEFESVKRYLLLDIVLRVADHDLRVMDASQVKMHRAYRKLLLAIQDRVMLDMAALRRLFRQAGIRIYGQQRDRGGVTAWFACRGYHHRISLLSAFIRAQAEEILLDYLRPDRLRTEGSGAFTHLSIAQKSRPSEAPDG